VRAPPHPGGRRSCPRVVAAATRGSEPREHTACSPIHADLGLAKHTEVLACRRVYVVWQDCHFEPTCNASDLVLSTSTDGKSWSKLTRLPLDPIGSGVDHFIPGLAVDRSTSGSSAHLLVTFYYPVSNCAAATCQLDVGYSSSADGGATWTSTTQLAGPMALSWLPNTSQGRMVADYLSGSFVGGPVFPAFAVASAPSGGPDCETATPTCNQPIFTVSGGLTVSGANPALDTASASAGGGETLTGSTVTAQ
jgi:hypothetical protein